MRRSVDLARAVRDQLAGDGRARWVAGSAGPYGAALADGSEYRGGTGAACGNWRPGTGRGWRRWPRRAPDVLALETVPDTDEAEALMTAIAGLGIPAWLSYTIASGRTRAGQSLGEAFAVAAGVPEVVAVGSTAARQPTCRWPSPPPAR
jgi:homocysteine S-methyltransferase